MHTNGTIQSAVVAVANLNLGGVLGRDSFGFPTGDSMPGFGDFDTADTEASAGTDAPVDTTAPEKAAGGTRLTDKPAKKVYDTPYIPRSQYFKMLRDQGLLKPRQPKAKADQATSDEPKVTKAKAPKQSSAPKTEKPVRSAKQLAAIRGSYARKRAASKAAQTA